MNKTSAPKVTIGGVVAPAVVPPFNWLRAGWRVIRK